MSRAIQNPERYRMLRQGTEKIRVSPVTSDRLRQSSRRYRSGLYWLTNRLDFPGPPVSQSSLINQIDHSRRLPHCILVGNVFGQNLHLAGE